MLVIPVTSDFLDTVRIDRLCILSLPPEIADSPALITVIIIIIVVKDVAAGRRGALMVTSSVKM